MQNHNSPIAQVGPRTDGPNTPPLIIRAQNDLLFADDGSVFIDFFTGYGATWLGHCHPKITGTVQAQLSNGWLLGGLQSPASIVAKRSLEEYFRGRFQFGGLYSTGMEAAEFAIRIARVATGRNGVLGFDGSMHGKSVATSLLGWNNVDRMAIPGFLRLPFLRSAGEPEILNRIEDALQSEEIGAIFLELIQGSNGGLHASPGFYRSVGHLAKRYGALLICDEILTGFYRAGAEFRFAALGLEPDVLLIGKAFANGFPVSGVMLKFGLSIQQKMLSGSTFSGNPLACAAVAATLEAMQTLDLADRAQSIKAAILESLGWVEPGFASLRGDGALWVVEMNDAEILKAVVRDIQDLGVIVGSFGHQFRILPAATIAEENLHSGCQIVSQVMRRHAERS